MVKIPVPCYALFDADILLSTVWSKSPAVPTAAQCVGRWRFAQGLGCHERHEKARKGSADLTSEALAQRTGT